MNYQKPTMIVVGNARSLVHGTKGETPVADGVNPYFVQSMNAYEADE